MHTCGHGKPIDDFCEYCEEMGGFVLELRETIKKLEEENARLKIAIRNANDKLSTTQRRLYRVQEDSWNDVTPDRDDR